MGYVKVALGHFIFALSLVPYSYAHAQSFEVLPDLNLTLEGEEAPAPDQPSPNASILHQFVEPIVSAENELRVLLRYQNVDPEGLIPKGLLRRALTYFDANNSKIPNKKFLGILDYAAHSALRRFFIVNMITGEVWALHVAHGTGSDENNNGLLEQVSNIEGSHMSSRGFILTAEIYHGKYGRSLRLDGLSSTNSNLRQRAVVVHGAEYVQDREVQQGRSWGCLALPMNYKDRAIDYLAGGALIYAGISPEHWSDNR